MSIGNSLELREWSSIRYLPRIAASGDSVRSGILRVKVTHGICNRFGNTPDLAGLFPLKHSRNFDVYLRVRGAGLRAAAQD